MLGGALPLPLLERATPDGLTFALTKRGAGAVHVDDVGEKREDVAEDVAAPVEGEGGDFGEEVLAVAEGGLSCCERGDGIGRVGGVDPSRGPEGGFDLAGDLLRPAQVIGGAVELALVFEEELAELDDDRLLAAEGFGDLGLVLVDVVTAAGGVSLLIGVLLLGKSRAATSLMRSSRRPTKSAPASITRLH